MRVFLDLVSEHEDFHVYVYSRSYFYRNLAEGRLQYLGAKKGQKVKAHLSMQVSCVFCCPVSNSLTVRTIWHHQNKIEQFDTINTEEDNLTPRTIWRHHNKKDILTPWKIWHHHNKKGKITNLISIKNYLKQSIKPMIELLSDDVIYEQSLTSMMFECIWQIVSKITTRNFYPLSASGKPSHHRLLQVYGSCWHPGLWTRPSLWPGSGIPSIYADIYHWQT